MEFWNDGFISLVIEEASLHTRYSITPMFQHSIRVEVRRPAASFSSAG
jgi:hypothetical protein